MDDIHIYRFLATSKNLFDRDNTGGRERNVHVSSKRAGEKLLLQISPVTDFIKSTVIVIWR